MQPRSSEVKHLFRLAAPVAAAHLANMIMQLVDTFFVGRLGATAIGGVSVGNALFATLMVVGIGLLLGIDFVASKAFGAGRLNEVHRCLVQAVYLAVFIAVPFTLLMLVSTGFFAAFGITSDVAVQGELYLKTVSLSLLPLLVFMAFRQYLQAMGIAAPVLWILVVANIVNAFANWVFVWGKLGVTSMGVTGSGLATFIARSMALVAIVAYTIWNDRRKKLGLQHVSKKPKRKEILSLVRLGLPAGAQLLLEVGVFATATLLAGRMGAAPLAAHQIVLHIASCTFMIPLGLSAAGAVRVAQALGAGQPHRAVRIGWTALGMAVSFMAFSGLTLYLLSWHLMRIFTFDPNVIQLGQSLMLIAALFQLSDGIQVTATGILRGIGDTRSSMYANLAGHWFVGLPIGFLMGFSWNRGVQGIWIGLSIGLTLVAAALAFAWSKQSKSVR